MSLLKDFGIDFNQPTEPTTPAASPESGNSLLDAFGIDAGPAAPVETQVYKPQLPADKPRDFTYDTDPNEKVHLFGWEFAPEIDRSTPLLGGLSSAFQRAVAPKPDNPEFGQNLQDIPVVGGLERMGEMAWNVLSEASNTVGTPLAGYGGTVIGQVTRPIINGVGKLFGNDQVLEDKAFERSRAEIMQRAGYANEDALTQAFIDDPLNTARKMGLAAYEQLPEDYGSVYGFLLQLGSGMVFDPINYVPFGGLSKFKEAKVLSGMKDVAEMSRWEKLAHGITEVAGLIPEEELLRPQKWYEKFIPWAQTNMSRALSVASDMRTWLTSVIDAAPSTDDAIRRAGVLAEVAKDTLSQADRVAALREQGYRGSKVVQQFARTVSGLDKVVAETTTVINKVDGAFFNLAATGTDAAALKAALAEGLPRLRELLPGKLEAETIAALRTQYKDLPDAVEFWLKAAEKGKFADKAEAFVELQKMQRAMLADAIRSATDANLIKYFGLKDIHAPNAYNFFQKVATNVKAAEALVFLGWNPIALARNAINNRATMFVDGLDFVFTSKKMAQLSERMGIGEQTLRSIINSGDSLAKALGMQRGSVYEGLTNTANKINQFARRASLLGIYQNVEEADRNTALVAGVMKALNQNLRVGRGLPELPELARELSPRMQQQIIGLVEANVHKANGETVIREGIQKMISGQITPYLEAVRNEIGQVLQSVIGSNVPADVRDFLGGALTQRINEAVERIAKAQLRDSTNIDRIVNRELVDVMNEAVDYARRVGGNYVVRSTVLDEMGDAMRQVARVTNDGRFSEQQIKSIQSVWLEHARNMVYRGEYESVDAYLNAKIKQFAFAPDGTGRPVQNLLDDLRDVMATRASQPLTVDELTKRQWAAWIGEEYALKQMGGPLRESVLPNISSPEIRPFVETRPSNPKNPRLGLEYRVKDDTGNWSTWRQSPPGLAGEKGFTPRGIAEEIRHLYGGGQQKPGFTKIGEVLKDYVPHDVNVERTFVTKEGKVFLYPVDAISSTTGKPITGLDAQRYAESINRPAVVREAKGKTTRVPLAQWEERTFGRMTPEQIIAWADQHGVTGWKQKVTEQFQKQAQGMFDNYVGGRYKTMRNDKQVLEKIADGDRIIKMLGGDGIDLKTLGQPHGFAELREAPGLRVIEQPGDGTRPILRAFAPAIGLDVRGVVDNGTMFVRWSNITDPEMVGKGYGQGAYKALFDAAFQRGLKVASDDSVSEDAARIYEKLGRYFQIEKNPKAVELEQGIVKRWKTPDGSPVFTVVGPKANAVNDPRMYGVTQFMENGQAMIKLFDNADISTVVEESAHVFFGDLRPEELDTVTRWISNADDLRVRRVAENLSAADRKAFLEWQANPQAVDYAAALSGGRITPEARMAQEVFASGFIDYLRNGDAPAPELRSVFEKFKQWLNDIWRSVRTNFGVDSEQRKLYDALFVPDEAAEARTVGGMSQSRYNQILGRSRGVVRDDVTAFRNALGVEPDFDRALSRLKSTANTNIPPEMVQVAQTQAWAAANNDLIATILPRLREVLTNPQSYLHDEFIPRGVADALDTWLRKEVMPAQRDVVHASMLMGREFERMALLNYSDRWNVDALSSFYAPFWFWRIHSGVNWTQRFIDRPGMANMYFNMLKDFQRASNSPEFPERLRGNFQIPIPLLDKWMGGGILVDPLQSLLPISDIFLAEANQMGFRQVTDQQVAAQIRAMVQSGQLDAMSAQTAMVKKSGSLWDTVKKGIQASNEQPFNAFTSTMQPHYPIQLITALASGKADELGPVIPASRIIKGATALLFGGTGFNLEEPYKRALRAVTGNDKIPLWDAYDTYRAERSLRDMVAEGLIKPEQALQAMIEHTGDIWQNAQERAARMQGVANITSAGIRVDIFPQGERNYYIAKEIRSQLMDEEIRKLGLSPDLKYEQKIAALKDAGRMKRGTPLGDIYQTYPELGSATQLYNTMEGRLNRMMTDSVLDSYWSATKLDQRKMRSTMGPEFEAFVNNYKYNPKGEVEATSRLEVPLDELAKWTAWLKRYVPKPDPSYETALDTPRIKPYTAVDPVLSKQYDTYLNGLARFGDGINEIEQKYFQFAEGSPERRAILSQHPELREKWDWTRQFWAEHPQLKQLIDNLNSGTQPAVAVSKAQAPTTSVSPRVGGSPSGGGGSPATSAPTSKSSGTYVTGLPKNYWANFDPGLLYRLDMFFRNNQPLSGPDLVTLQRLWRQLGGGQSFQTWMTSLKMGRSNLTTKF